MTHANHTPPTPTVSPLRQRMTDDMCMRTLSKTTQLNYIRAVKRFTHFLGDSPDHANAEDLRKFQLFMVECGVSTQTINATISGLRFFFEVTLDKPMIMRKMSRVHTPRKLPTVLSPSEVTILLQATHHTKYRAAFSVAYGAGLRSSEVTHLKIADIDSQQMILHVEQGKGDKDRNAMLSPRLLAILRAWWREGHSQHGLMRKGWLFPGKDPVNPITTRQLQVVFMDICYQLAFFLVIGASYLFWSSH